jgi:spermidine/putrescine transport system permease protein
MDLNGQRLPLHGLWRTVQLAWLAALCLVLSLPVAGLWMLALAGPGSSAGTSGNLMGSALLDELSQSSAPIFRSLLVGVISAAMAVTIGSALALQLWFLGARANGWLLLIALPAFLPPIIVAIGATISFSLLSIYGGLWPIVTAHVFIGAALATPLLLGALKNTAPSLIVAANNLGVPLTRTLAAIMLGWHKSTLMAAWLIAFAFSWNEFIIAWFVGGTFTTLPVALYQSLASRFDSTTAALALLGWMIAVIFCAIGVASIARKSLRLT